MTPVAQVLAWVADFVIGLGLCPFAAKPWRAGTVKALELEGEDAEALFYGALAQVQSFVLQEAGEVETLLLVLPWHLDAFEDFLGFVEAIEDALAETGADALVQLAHFHPHYQFDGVDAEDPGNRTNRSPWPVVQLLRVETVARAVAEYPDVEGIPGRNVGLMRAMDLNGDGKPSPT